MEFLDEMMKDYLGDALQSCQSRSKPHTEMREEQNNEQQRDSGSYKHHRSGSTPSPSHSYSEKRRKIDNYTDMNELRDEFVNDYIREMKYNPLKSDPNEDRFQFLPPLWSMEPRIFALETASSGKRKYIVGNLGRFLDHYWRKSDPLNRHYYELIREKTPCRLYFGTSGSILIDHTRTWCQDKYTLRRCLFAAIRFGVLQEGQRSYFEYRERNFNDRIYRRVVFSISDGLQHYIDQIFCC
jgi:VanZ family protein